MAYKSVDALQKSLSDSVFSYAKDRKKAAGRALGTLVELVTFYILRAWGLRDHILIERSVPEYGNPAITHNVEFSLHSIVRSEARTILKPDLPVTVAKLREHFPFEPDSTTDAPRPTNQLITSDELLRNSCVLFETSTGPVVANVDAIDRRELTLTFSELSSTPFAIFECKRVGVEEGMERVRKRLKKPSKAHT